jgi:serine/threonine-protein kinase
VSPNEELERARKRLAPAAVSDAVIKALARDPNDRFATARDFAIALEAAIVVAPPHRVGEWVQEFGGPELIGRQRMVTQIERYSFNFSDEFTPNPVSVGAVPSSAHSDDATQRDVRPARATTPGATMPGATMQVRSTAARRRTVMILGLVALGVTVFTLWPQGAPPEPPPLEVRVSRPFEPPARALPSAQQATPAPTAAPAAAPSVSANLPMPAASSAKLLRGVSPKPHTPPKKDPCNPPWRVDSRGIRHPIPGCY